MSITRYQRTLEELRLHASMFWPSDLSQREAELSVIPKLLETQDQFIAILSIEVESLDKLFKIVNASSLAANMFLKHLIVLADFGGEMLQRINTQFGSLFPTKKLEFFREDVKQFYSFQKLPVTGSLDNKKLGVSGQSLLEKRKLSPLLEDVTTILMFGSLSNDERVAETLAKCEIGTYLGRPDKLSKFIKQRYIQVSRITGGSQSNSLGQLAQSYVIEHLQANLVDLGATIKSNGQIPGITYSDSETTGQTTFDVVVSNNQNKYVAIEISFQVTTNSVIERKRGQAQSRYTQINKAGYKIAYIIDGAGNFQRENSIRVLCSYSDCTVAFSRLELDFLCQFIREYFLS